MQLYDIGPWIKVEYLNEKARYFQKSFDELTEEDLGNVFVVYHLCDGLVHREDGPAYIRYGKDGSVDFQQYYLNDDLLTKEEWEKQVAAS